MDVEDLYVWRDKFDKLRTKYWKTNPKQVPEFQSKAPGLVMPDKVVI